MKNIKLTIAYDGSHYGGWQEVGTGPSIEGTLQSVLEQILQSPTPLQAASRTDAGVHATGQVVNFFTDKEISLRSLNALLPPDIRVMEIEEALLDFHPTLDAQSKEYHYHLCLGEVQSPQYRHTSWHMSNLNLNPMEEAASYLVGTYDFQAFTNSCKQPRENTIRTLHELTLHPLPDGRLKVVLKANAFLFRMARNLVGTLVHVGQGKLAPQEVATILEGKERTKAGMCAPAYGLCLTQVNYQSNLDQVNITSYAISYSESKTEI